MIWMIHLEAVQVRVLTDYVVVGHAVRRYVVVCIVEYGAIACGGRMHLRQTTGCETRHIRTHHDRIVSIAVICCVVRKRRIQVHPET